MHIGIRIKQRREEIGWSQRELAKRMGYTNNSTLAKIEQGKVDVSHDKLLRFANVLGISVIQLVGDDDAEFIENLGPLHNKEKLSPEMEAINTLLYSHGLQIMKTNGEYYFGEAGQLTEGELNEFLNTVTTMVHSAADVLIQKKKNQMRDFFSKK